MLRLLSRATVMPRAALHLLLPLGSCTVRLTSEAPNLLGLLRLCPRRSIRVLHTHRTPPPRLVYSRFSKTSTFCDLLSLVRGDDRMDLSAPYIHRVVSKFSTIALAIIARTGARHPHTAQGKGAMILLHPILSPLCLQPPCCPNLSLWLPVCYLCLQPLPLWMPGWPSLLPGSRSPAEYLPEFSTSGPWSPQSELVDPLLSKPSTFCILSMVRGDDRMDLGTPYVLRAVSKTSTTSLAIIARTDPCYRHTTQGEGVALIFAAHDIASVASVDPT